MSILEMYIGAITCWAGAYLTMCVLQIFAEVCKALQECWSFDADEPDI